jgi:hypothetical protein
VICCTPCVIPKHDLQFEIAFYAYVDTGSSARADHLSTRTITLTYSQTGPNFDQQFWTGSVLCPDGVSRQVQMICRENDLTVGLASGGTVFIEGPPTYRTFFDPYTVTSWPATGGFVNPPMFNGNITSLISGSYTCEPFFWQDNFADDTNFAGIRLTGAYAKVTDPSPGTYAAGACCVTNLTVNGCSGVIVPSATYTVWTDSGKLSQIATGTTDSGGNVTLDVNFCNISLYREISHPRFVTATGSVSFNGANQADNAMTTPAAGYTCLPGCGAPIANTIHATFAVAGAKTLVNSGSGWTVSFTASTHAYVVTLAANSTLTITRDGVSCGTVTWTLNFCPPNFNGSITIPAGNCLTELGNATVTE